jgi:hypothetical protein
VQDKYSRKPQQVREWFDDADGWVIAHAFADEDGIVVTEEYERGSYRSKIKIPALCKVFDIECINTALLLRWPERSVSSVTASPPKPFVAQHCKSAGECDGGSHPRMSPAALPRQSQPEGRHWDTTWRNRHFRFGRSAHEPFRLWLLRKPNRSSVTRG